MQYRQLCPGYTIVFDCEGKYDHYLGGENTLRGGQCPNCEKPLLQYLSLDTSDPRLKLGELGVHRLPLLYCTRCAIQTSRVPFYYQVMTDDTVRIYQYRPNPEYDLPYKAQWREKGFGDVFPRRLICLKAIPSRLQDLYERLNASDTKLTTQEEADAKTLGNSFLVDEEGKIPCLDPPNQIGGIPYYKQGIDSPQCSLCLKGGVESEMYALASLYNSEIDDFRITFEWFQIVFFICLECRSIHADQIV